MFDEYKNNQLVNKLATDINKLSKQIDKLNFMEVCGTHTMSIAKFGIKNLLPKNINLVSGPGCPVCVTPCSTIDNIIELSKISNNYICTFGDMMRVPGSKSSLIKEKANGANIKIIYSPLDAINLAKQNPSLNIIYIAIGFETTTPLTAATIRSAKKQKLENFYVLCAHKNMPSVLELIAKDPQINIDGLILPGHVSSIIGLNPYNFLSEKYNIPGCICGFEPVDILFTVKSLIIQVLNNTAKIENNYTRAVKTNGNKTAQKLIDDVFITCESEWRGFGNISNSGFLINDTYKNFDAFKKFKLSNICSVNKLTCKCGEVLRGKITPNKCKLYKLVCNPQNPVGPCMVSSEGTCAAYYKYKLQ